MPLRSPPALLAAALLAACSPEAVPAAPPAGGAERVHEVRTVPVEMASWPETLAVSGELAPHEVATLSSKVAGRVQSIAVDLGSRVAAGESIVQIDPRDHELRVEQARATLEAVRALLGLKVEESEGAVDASTTALVRSAQAELEEARLDRDRVHELVGSGVAPRAQLERAEARLTRAQSEVQAALEAIQNRRALVVQREAELEIARQQLADTRIAAPFDGAVAERLVATGDYVSPGDGVARLVRDDPLRLRLELGEVDAGRVREGQRVLARIDGREEPIEARISRVSPLLGARSRTLVVEAEIANPEHALRPGAFARAQILVDADARRLTVPESALVRFAGIDKVIAVEDGRAVERRVRVGRIADGRVEVLSGLEPGIEVVLEPGGIQGGATLRVGE